MCGPSQPSGGGSSQGPSIESQRQDIALQNENDRLRVETNFYNWLTQDGKLFEEIKGVERDLETARTRQATVEGAGGQGNFGVSALETSLSDLKKQRSDNQFVFDFQTNFGSGDIAGGGFSDSERQKNASLQAALEGKVSAREDERVARAAEAAAQEKAAQDAQTAQSEAGFVTGGSATSGNAQGSISLPELESDSAVAPAAALDEAIKKKKLEDEQTNKVSSTQDGGSTQSNLVQI